MDKLLLIGGGGNCHSVLDSAIATNKYAEFGIVDFAEHQYLGVRVIGRDEDIPELVRAGWNCAIITVGSIGNTAIRRRLYDIAIQNGMKMVSVIDPSAIVAKDAVIQNGCFIGKHAVINSGAFVGECCIINTGSLIEHECEIGSFAHISPGSVLCGQVRIGNDTHIGAGSVIRQGITIGSNAIIGIGSVVVKNIPDHVKAYGNPCKVVE